MLAHRHGPLDEEVEVLGDLGSHTLGLEDTQDLVAGDEAHLGDAMRISQDHT